VTVPARRGGRPARQAERARLTVERRQARRLARFLDSDAAGRSMGYLLPLHRHGARVQVPLGLRRGTVIGAGWPGQCYEVALGYLLRHFDVPGLRLVHGYVVEGDVEQDLPWQHAWVELPDEAIYDPSTGEFFQLASFYQVLKATPLCTYTAEQALARYDAEGAAGPWPEFKALHKRGMGEHLARLLEAHPGLAAWLDEMRRADPVFAARLDAAQASSGVRAAQAVEYLAATGRWRDHRPGQGWDGALHPLGLV